MSAGGQQVHVDSGERTSEPTVTPANQPRTRLRTAAVMSPRQQWQYWVIVMLWAFVNGQFWAWWLGGNHVGNPILFFLASIAQFYAFTILASMYLFYIGHMRKPVPVSVQHARDAGALGQVATISLTVPGSESLEFVRRQLIAMSQITQPHDSWILVDKVHSPEIAEMAESLGVKYFCRHDEKRWGKEKVAAWSEPATKAGNVNCWLSVYGDQYSHFTQFDIDHYANPDYLDKVLGYFIDPKVKWVQAPSIYGNLDNWIARGSAEQELGLQGPLQMGYFGFSQTPFIIGSHCTYETAAIKSIGGFQITRAEDHLDTVALAAEGYEGVFVPEVIAVGEGPERFDTYLAQQFAWSFSMFEVLFFHMLWLLPRYNRRQAMQFLFAETWYGCYSLSMLAMFLLPLVSLSFNTPLSHVGYFGYLSHSLPVVGMGTVIWLWSRDWTFPAGLRLTWRGVVLHVARWVFVVDAFAQVVLRAKKDYMITKKGVDKNQSSVTSLRLLAPYAVLTLLPMAACWRFTTVYREGPCQGYLFLALQGALVFWLLLLTVTIQELRADRRHGWSLSRRLRLHAGPVLLVAVLGVLLLATSIQSAEPTVEAIMSRF